MTTTSLFSEANKQVTALPTSTYITAISTQDRRFALGEGVGTDSIHQTPNIPTLSVY
ncbi:hypothetical protein [Spirosoma telluris]|uniref:hypothetical protein n=1 Tax=Spirosoma telluris TaxID=2183553 RepID=UPI002FC2ADE1